MGHYTTEELDSILELHRLYLNNDIYGVRANLNGADLSEAYLRGANLSVAYLRGANLSVAYLRGANLNGADLSEANLSRAYLIEANLIEADLSEANLSGADLSGAYLRGANLNGADLSEANLSGANLSEANLSGADLTNIIGKDIVTYSKGKHQLIYMDGFIRIGCQYHSLDYWIENGSEIGEDAGYSPEQIKNYMRFIKSLKWV